MRIGGAQTLTEVFEQQAAAHPDHIAAECPERRYTYRELNETADRIAAAILAEVGPGSEPVPILLPHGSAFLAAMFGVLKAGKIFTTFDAGHPPSRLGAMMDDLKARIVLTDAGLRAVAGEIAGTRAKVLDMDEAASAASRSAQASCAAPDDLAWILWTSGSTGMPKGVTKTHRTAVRMCLDYAALLEYTPQDRVSLFHPNLTWDIFGSLLTGAGIFPFDIRRNGIDAACHWVLARQLTCYRAFPTTFRRMMEAAGERRFESVRLVHLSGEAVSPGDLASFEKHFSPGSSVMVLYGSSEGGMGSASFMPHGSAAAISRVSIGRPLPGVDLMLLNERAEPCPPGETGEIALRSPYVFPGYWRRPELTQAAFLPGWTSPEQRVFLTGDLARLRPDGELEYAGRKDGQVKVRGHRIELAEIELALQKHPRIRVAVAKLYQGRNGEDRLAAYLLPHDGPAPRDSELYRFLDGGLPHHMHPDRFIVVNEIPLTSNGKADRKALPAPDRSRPNIDVAYAPPQEGVEQAIARMFEDALDVEPVGAHDSFFELGGKSLAALRVLTCIAETYGVSIPPRAFFEAPTPAAAALRVLEGAADAASEEELARLLEELEAQG